MSERCVSAPFFPAMSTEQVAGAGANIEITETPNKKRKFMSPSLDAVEMDTQTNNENLQMHDIENDLRVSSDSESGSDPDSDSDDGSAKQPKSDKNGLPNKAKKSRSKFVPRNIVHNFKFPLILEDIGKSGSAEQLADYDFDLNRLMTLAQIGRIKTSKKISSKKYIIDCFSDKQRENTLKLVQLRTPGGGYIPIKPRIPEPTTEGVIGPIGRNVSMEELKEKIDEYNQSNPTKIVSNAERLKKFQDGSLKETSFIKLTFKCSTLPNAVKLGCNFYPVEANRRDPMLCSKCFRLGHTRNKCFKKTHICGKCLGPKHEFGEQECPLDKSQWRCPNCNIKGHSASWPRCPQKLKLKKALLIQSKHYMPLAAALELVTGEEKSNPLNDPVGRTNQFHNSLSTEQNFPELESTHRKGQKLWRTYAQSPHHRVEPLPTSLGDSGADGESTQRQKDKDKTKTKENIFEQKNNNLSLDTILEAIKRNNEIVQEKIDKSIKSIQDDNEKKFERITSSINEIKSQNQQKMQMISEFIKNKKQTANQSEQIALDIVDSIRQAAEGNPDAIFVLAKKFSKSGQDISNELKAEISNLTQTISF